MAINPVSENFYTKSECALISVVAYAGLTLLVIGLITQLRLDVLSPPRFGINASALIAAGSTLLILEVAFLVLKKYVNKNSEKVEQDIENYIVEPLSNTLENSFNIISETCDTAIETFDHNVGKHLMTAAKLTYHYVKENYKYLLGYLVAWSAIVLGLGLLHGFRSMAFPLAIGITGGLALGIAVGVVTVKSVPFTVEGEVFDPDQYVKDGIITADARTDLMKNKPAVFEKLCEFGAQEYIDHYSLWGLSNKWLNGLDENGTRLIIQTVLITILMTFVPLFPVPMGGLLGAICGNCLAVQIVYNALTIKKKDQDIKGFPTPSREEKAIYLSKRGSVSLGHGVDFKT